MNLNENEFATEKFATATKRCNNFTKTFCSKVSK